MISVRLPRDQVRQMLHQELLAAKNMADLCMFNLAHDQHDLLRDHLARVEKHCATAEELRRALAPN